MQLREALHIQRGDMVAFIGAGGKTSALFRLADELRAKGWRVLATTTTRVARHEVLRMPLATQLNPEVTPDIVNDWLDQYGTVFLYGAEDIWRNKIIGLRIDVVSGLLDSVQSDVILIEADGARRLPLKAPRNHEPVIPAETSIVVPVAGIDALGQPLDDEHIYNATRIQERYGFPAGAPLIVPWMALILRDPALGLQGVPDSARVVVLINKIANNYQRGKARRVAELVLRSPRIEAVALGAVQSATQPVQEVQRRVAAIVLAGGLSKRMGQSKALLPWGRRTVIETIVSKLVNARLAEVLVVTGHRAEDVARTLADQAVRTVYNPNYAQGEMLSSLQVGLRALPVDISACLVVMGDQPMIDPRVVGRVLHAYAENKGEIVIPTHRGERGHPVLIGQRFWPELLALETGAPRDMIRRHPDQLALLEVNSDSILRDLDTPEQYRQERRLAGLT